MPEEIKLEDIIKRLETFGVEYNEEDKWFVGFISKMVVNELKSECNIDCVPVELYEKVINKICGEFLYEKRSKNELPLDNINTDNMVSSIKLGDSQVNFGDSNLTDVQRLDNLIELLINSLTNSDYISFRRFKW